MIPTSNQMMEPTASRRSIRLPHDFNPPIRVRARLRSRQLILVSLGELKAAGPRAVLRTMTLDDRAI